MNDYLPWEFDAEIPMDEDTYESNWFDSLKVKYKNRRAEILPKEKWQPLIDEWLNNYSDPNTWFTHHIKPGVDADLYRAALKSREFAWHEIENQYRETPIYLETPLCGLDVDQNILIETVKDMENKNGILYYRNIPAPVIDLLYEEVFEERLAYPERFS